MGSIIIDDYYDWEGCRKATDEYLSTISGQYKSNNEAGSLKITKIEHNQSINDTKQRSKTMNFNEINLEEFLKKYSGQNIVYCPNPGNAGDAIIAYATFKLFEKLGIHIKIINYADQIENQIIFYAGGGNLVECKYKDTFHFIKNNHAQNREIVLLPHTVHGYDDLLLSTENLTIFCREKVSYEYLSFIGFPGERLFLAHDMAFSLGDVDFEQYKNKGKGIANCFRTDQESSKSFDIPDNNVDISLIWVGDFWHRPKFAKNVTHNLASYLSDFNTVKTDRLHIAILAAMMGKQVIMYPNNYYKNKAVFNYSIKERWKNVSFIEFETQNDQLALKHENKIHGERIKQLESELEEKIKYITELEFVKKKLENVFESKSWRMTKLLRDLKTFLFQKR